MRSLFLVMCVLLETTRGHSSSSSEVVGSGGGLPPTPLPQPKTHAPSHSPSAAFSSSSSSSPSFGFVEAASLAKEKKSKELWLANYALLEHSKSHPDEGVRWILETVRSGKYALLDTTTPASLTYEKAFQKFHEWVSGEVDIATLRSCYCWGSRSCIVTCWRDCARCRTNEIQRRVTYDVNAIFIPRFPREQFPRENTIVISLGQYIASIPNEIDPLPTQHQCTQCDDLGFCWWTCLPCPSPCSATQACARTTTDMRTIIALHPNDTYINQSATDLIVFCNPVHSAARGGGAVEGLAVNTIMAIVAMYVVCFVLLKSF